VIVRLTGPDAIEVLQNIFSKPIPKAKASIISGHLAIDPELSIDAKLYLFFSPHSYTGENVVEIHTYANPSVIEALFEQMFGKGLRMAQAGEFTARAYLNGKMDLTQAEAVNEIITAGNRFQLSAAEKLLSGRLAEKISRIRSDLMDCLTLIEAGIDFSGEDIEFLSQSQAVERFENIKSQLEQLLAGTISYETLIDLPSVGIAGAPNAGKSSLLNAMLGSDRSIVSPEPQTTRDILTGRLTLRHCRCVLFDCAGLITGPTDIIERLSQYAAIESLKNSSIVLFCVDVSKNDWTEDIAIRKLIEPQVLIAVANKTDLLSESQLTGRLVQLEKLFDTEFLAVSAKTCLGLEQLSRVVDSNIIDLTVGRKGQTRYAIRNTQYAIALTARHKQAVTEAVESIDVAIEQLSKPNEEIVAMMIRAAYQLLSGIEREHINEKVLDNIFNRFCIGK